MKITYLGSAASEGWPALFCDCPICAEAARRGGRDIRSRASALIDDDILLDVSPDIHAARTRLNVSLGHVRTLLVTHSHSDHFALPQLGWYAPGFAADPHRTPLLIAGSAKTGEFFERLCALHFRAKTMEWLRFQTLNPFEPAEISNARVTLFPAEHGADGASVYMIERDGKKLLYMHDTGRIYDEVWDYLKSLKSPVDLVSLDAVCGPRRAPDGCGHMSFVQDAEIRAHMLDTGIATTETHFVSNHICIHDCRTPNGFMFYDDMVEFCRPLGLTPSYDGMSVTL